MRPSFWKAPVSCLVILVCWISMSFPKSALALGSPEGKTNLEIGAFNIQVFGDSKVNKPNIRSAIISIISRYDVIFIQEIRDDQNEAIFHLLSELNILTGRNYHALVSPRLGRGIMKEQYAYFYDADVVRALDFYLYDDVFDEFAREPFVARFQGLGQEFSLAGIHVAPTDVRGELRGLGKVHRDIKDRYDDESLFILGDMNADCLYYNPSEGFDYFDVNPKVLIGDDVDTSVAPASCAYDRILGFGSILSDTSAAKAYDFMDVMGLSLDEARLISDHFPVEFSIAGRGAAFPAPPAEEEVALPEIIDLNELMMCGEEPYLTPGGYCYGGFSDGMVRVSAICCAG